MKIKLFSLILFVFAICLSNCSSKEKSVPLLADSKEPIHVYGGDTSGPYYKFIWDYLLDLKNDRVYIWDYLNPDNIDVYNESGRFLFKFGKRGSGPAEFLTISKAAADSHGNIWIDDGNRKSLKIFSDHGKYLREIILPHEVRFAYIKKMLFNKYDDLYVLARESEGRIIVYKLDIEKNNFRMIYKEGHRLCISIVDFIPDIALDDNSNLYVTDSFDYRIHVFNKEGDSINVFEARKGKRERIEPHDFNIFDNNFKIVKFPGHKAILVSLTGPSRYFPVIFGINIDNGLVYVWTSERDSRGRYMIDIYNMKFESIGRACYFNFVKDNVAEIIDGKLYITSIENYEAGIVDSLGRFTFLNSPDHLNAYRISRNR